VKRCLFKAELSRFAARANFALSKGVRMFHASHGALTFNYSLRRVPGPNDTLRQELLVSGVGVHQRAAIHCLQTADPETILELVRGYAFALEHGLAPPVAEDK
jgi:hypothetical protein